MRRSVLRWLTGNVARTAGYHRQRPTRGGQHHRWANVLLAAGAATGLLIAPTGTAPGAREAARETPKETAPLTGLVQLTERAWAWVARDERSANSAIFVGDDAALIVDPGLTPAIAQELIDAVHGLTDKPIRWALLTHWHPDHALGAACLGDTGIDTVAHPKTRRALAENGAGLTAFFADQATSGAEAAALDTCVLSLPRPLGEHETSFELGGLRVELFHPGHAHSPGDLVVWAPQERVLVTGDILMNEASPSMGDGNVLVWIEALQRLEELAPEHVIPGHFAPGDTSTVRRFRSYLQAQVKHAEKSLQGGLSADATAASATFPEFATFAQFPQYAATFEGNARSVHRDLRARPAARGHPGVFRVVKRLDAGQAPHQIAFSADGTQAYVAAAGSHQVTVIDTETLEVTGVRVAPGTPLGVAELPGGNDLAVTAFGADRIVRLVAGQEKPAESLATGEGSSLLVGPLPGELYLFSTEKTNRLRVLDANSFTLLHAYPTGRRPFPPAATSDGRKAFVPDHDDGTVTVVDLWNETILATVRVGERPSGGTVWPADMEYAVAVRGENRLVFINTASHQVTGELTAGIGDSPFSVVVAPDGLLAFVNNTASHDVSVIEIATRRVVARIPVGEIPITLSVHPSGSTLWVACEGSHEVVIIDLSAWAATNTPERPQDTGKPTEVAVMGMIHGGHRDSATWGLTEVRDTIRRFRPDVVCAEIPPDRWQRIWSDWSERGVIADDRVQRFPEYTDVLLPLAVEMGFTIEPCAGWTSEMANLRRARIDEFEREPRFAAELAEYRQQEAAVRERHAAEPIDENDPRVIHSTLYDRRTRESLAAYDQFLNDRIGPGGWANINRAHYALIESTLERHRGQRILITFGAGHKYWFLEQLRLRDDVCLVDLAPFLPVAAD